MFTKDLFFTAIGFLYLHWFDAFWSFISWEIDKIVYQINSMSSDGYGLKRGFNCSGSVAWGVMGSPLHYPFL
jgi:hypothetical protein